MQKDLRFSLVFSRALGKVIVHVHGSVDVDTAEELRDRLSDVIDGQGNRHLVVDLKGVTSIDAAGCAVLVDAVKRMKQHGGEFVLSAPAIDVTHVLDDAGLDMVDVVTPAWAHPAHRGDVTSLGGPGFRRNS